MVETQSPYIYVSYLRHKFCSDSSPEMLFFNDIYNIDHFKSQIKWYLSYTSL